MADLCHELMTRLQQHDQTVLRGSDGAIHFNDLIEECRRKKFDDAPQWLLEDWISTLASGGGAKKKFNIAWIQTLPINSCTFEQFKDCVARQKADSERIYRVPLPRREREWIEFFVEKWITYRKNKPQKRKTSGLLHCSEPDGWWIWYGRNSTRFDETKDRTIQEYLETPSK